MRVIYLYNLDGWALEDIGHGLRAALCRSGVDVEVQRIDRWLQQPSGADVLYLSWSGLVKPALATRRHAPRLLTTIHDPQEVSHFENRADWRRWPLRPLHWLETVDDVSVISDELRDVLATGYGRDAIRTPTWPSHWNTLRKAQDRHTRRPVKAVASTNLSAAYPWRRVASRFRHGSTYLVDARHRLSPRQLLGLTVRRRRKNIPALQRVAERFRDRRDVECEFHWGSPQFADRGDHERWLAAADVYVCASTMEGGPLPVMEAVLSGLAVVTTRVGQVADWVEDGRNGFLVDDAEDLGEALEAYARDRSLLRRHQQASEEVVAAFVPPTDPWIRFLCGSGK